MTADYTSLTATHNAKIYVDATVQMGEQSKSKSFCSSSHPWVVWQTV